MESVVDPVLALLDLDLGRSANLDDRNPAGELGKPLLKLLAIIVGGGVLDLLADRSNPSLDRFARASAIDDRRIVLVDRDPLGLAEHVDRDILKLDPKIFADHFSAGQDRNVLEHRLATIAKAWSLDGCDLEPAAKLVDDQSRKRFALDVLGDDEERTARLNHRFQNRKNCLEVRELLLVDEDVRVGQLDLHLFRVGDEIGRKIAAVELHAFDDIELELEPLGFLDRDHAFLADLLHRFGNLFADFPVIVGRNDPDLSDFVRSRNILGTRLEIFDHFLDRDIDAALQIHRVHSSGDRLHPFANDRLRKNRCSGRSVTGDVIGLRGHFAHHLSAHVLELVLKLDFLCDRDTVLGDPRCSEALVDDDVAALGPKRHADGVGENIDCPQDALTRIATEFHVFGSHVRLPLCVLEF